MSEEHIFDDHLLDLEKILMHIYRLDISFPSHTLTVGLLPCSRQEPS
jgi:hypothetical protein